MTTDNSRLSNTSRIADLSEDDKPREKALKLGIRSLSTTELLAIVLGSGMPGKSVIELSREIFAAAHNDVGELARFSIPDLCRRFSGVGPAKAVSLAAALELATRLKNDKTGQAVQVRGSADAFGYIRSQLENLDTEEFWILILSRSNHIRHAECISRGGTIATYVEPKVVVKRALDHLANGIILVHNHPSGQLRPSPQDDQLTKRIKDAAATLDIAVLDHLIIGSGQYYSYADEGRL